MTTKKHKGRGRRPKKNQPNRLREYRRGAGIPSIAAAAKIAGISPSLWQVWEAGPTLDNRTLASIRVMAWTVGVPVALLVTTEKELQAIGDF